MPCGGNNWPKIIYMFDREVVSKGMRRGSLVVVVEKEFRFPSLQLCVSFQLFILVGFYFIKGREFQTSLCSLKLKRGASFS